MSAAEFADAGLAEWTFESEAIHRHIRTADFASALERVNRIGELAEHRNHHPDLELGWGQVVVHLTSHDVGGVTERDVELARAIDSLA